MDNYFVSTMNNEGEVILPQEIISKLNIKTTSTLKIGVDEELNCIVIKKSDDQKLIFKYNKAFRKSERSDCLKA